MKNQELFNKTVSILVKAYQQGTLEHLNACACAIGNLICHYEQIPYNIRADRTVDVRDFGQYLKATAWHDAKDELEPPNKVLKQLEVVGYSMDQIIAIEAAFEQIPSVRKDKDGYRGLMSVVDTLMLIHEATPQEAESAKLQFVKA